VVNGVLSEIKIGASLNHPKINRIYGVAIDSEMTLLVVQELAKNSLADLLKENLTLKRKNIISLEIAEILYTLKTLKIIHRDLKPQNFLVNFNDSLQVCDFGSQVSENFCFTLHFAPPEIILEEQDGKGKVGYYSDIWSFGCILHRIYYGKDVWNGYTEAKMMKSLWEKKLPKVEKEDDVPVKISEIINKCLVFDENKRMTIEEILEEMKGIGKNGEEKIGVDNKEIAEEET